eukprot:2168078-Alexandrium_andersonii.AAC.1
MAVVSHQAVGVCIIPQGDGSSLLLNPVTGEGHVVHASSELVFDDNGWGRLVEQLADVGSRTNKLKDLF